jgi:hypothetical protein
MRPTALRGHPIALNTAEQRLGRIAAEADVRALAFTVFASVHHLFFSQIGRPVTPDTVRPVLASLLSGVVPY